MLQNSTQSATALTVQPDPAPNPDYEEKGKLKNEERRTKNEKEPVFSLSPAVAQAPTALLSKSSENI